MMHVRILYLNAADLAGSNAGPVVHILESLKALCDTGAAVDLYCPIPSGQPIASLGEITLQASGKGVFRLLRPLAAAVQALRRREPYDLVYFRADWRLSPVCMAAKRVGVPYVVEVNGIPLLEGPRLKGMLKKPVLCSADRWVYRNSLAVITVTAELADYIEHEYDVPRDRIHVIPNGVDTCLYSPGVKGNSRFCSNGSLTLGFLGSFWKWQGLHLLIQALPHMVEALPNLTVMLAGTGGVQEECALLAEQLRVADHIRWVGAVPYAESPSFVAACDVMVAPFEDTLRNRQTGLCPLKILMYMSSGKPFVTTHLPSLAWLAEVRSCLRFRPGDAADLADKCLRLLMLPAVERQELGLRGRDVAVRKYDWQVIGGQIMATIRDRLLANG